MDDHLGCQYIQDRFCLFKHSVELVLMLRNSQRNNVTCARLEVVTGRFFSNFLGLPEPKNEGSKILRNVGNYVPDDVA
jgi:hypothetical protein